MEASNELSQVIHAWTNPAQSWLEPLFWHTRSYIMTVSNISGTMSTWQVDAHGYGGDGDVCADAVPIPTVLHEKSNSTCWYIQNMYLFMMRSNNAYEVRFLKHFNHGKITDPGAKVTAALLPERKNVATQYTYTR
ncbi:hypothetical protein ANCCEY_13359 [Ancylostoma ceylanicum]|uniref:Uncharacterized protein n=1 Tax=Ancylostoma ceylanicum TaxID=53326 RepID=A0A0D6LIU8_9BILA|nr:hypothetical protein ANCCEY_13359 [Ancylostoma ceylanicum]